MKLVRLETVGVMLNRLVHLAIHIVRTINWLEWNLLVEKRQQMHSVSLANMTIDSVAQVVGSTCSLAADFPRAHVGVLELPNYDT